jgi:glycosyltransferase involved in cell wall biosynthesis
VQTAIESILNQSYTDFEFIIIDDASTDTTVTIIKSYHDSRIQLIEKSINSGYTNSLNSGLKIANGKYIARMDGDDISFPQRFAKQIAFLEGNPEVVVCGTSYTINRLLFLKIMILSK